MVVKFACLSDPKSWLTGALAPAIFSQVRLVDIREAEQSINKALQDGFKTKTHI